MEGKLFFLITFASMVALLIYTSVTENLDKRYEACEHTCEDKQCPTDECDNTFYKCVDTCRRS